MDEMDWAEFWAWTERHEPREPREASPEEIDAEEDRMAARFGWTKER